MEDFWYGMEENCQYGIWKNRLPFHTMPCSGARGLRFKSRQVKSDTVLPTARHCCNTSKEAMLPGRNDVEMGPDNSLHASAYYTAYNERFELIHLKLLPKCILLNCVFHSKLPFWQQEIW